jgi:hypothetical protein
MPRSKSTGGLNVAAAERRDLVPARVSKSVGGFTGRYERGLSATRVDAFKETFEEDSDDSGNTITKPPTL